MSERSRDKRALEEAKREIIKTLTEIRELLRRSLDVLMFSGKITISRLYIEPVPVDLVIDHDILYGKLSRMLDRGLVSNYTFYTEHTSVEALDVWSGYNIRDVLEGNGIREYENYISQISSLRFTPPPYFWEGNVYYGTVIHVPLSQPLGLYSEMRMELATQIHETSLIYDKDKRALGVLGVPVTIGGGVGVSAATYSKIANSILAKWAAQRVAVDVGKLSALTTSQTVAKVAGVVGIAIAVWGGIDAVLIKWGGLGEIQTQSWVVIAPRVVDKYGRVYTALVMYLPRKEDGKTVDVSKYMDVLKDHFKKLGYYDVGFMVVYLADTWDEYKRILEGGFTPEANLYEVVRTTIAGKYGLSMEELQITGVDILVVNRARAKETFWEWFFGLGGVYVDTVTLIGAACIKVKGLLRSGTLTDPSQIASALVRVDVNGVRYVLKPGSEGAYVEFSVTLGTSALVFKFPAAQLGYYGDLKIEVTAVVKSKFRDLNNYGYTTTVNYNWSSTLIRLSKIEFVDMPYPMMRCERTFIYEYGNFTHDLTVYFNLTSSIDDPLSPTGKLYYYITTNTLIFDPANGGILQPGKKYIINYYYSEPPDVSLLKPFSQLHSPYACKPRQLYG